MATFASHRLASLVLIDPVGIEVEGWIYPFLFGMELMDAGRHDLSQSGGGDGAGASGHELSHDRGDCTARARPWREWPGIPYLYDPLLRRRLARITVPTLLGLGRPRPAGAASVAREAWRKEIPGATLRVFDESGHVPHIEEPDAVAAAVAEFCASREATR